MKKIRNFILVFLFLFPSTNLFAGYVTFNQVVTVDKKKNNIKKGKEDKDTDLIKLTRC